jgi:hypothetical protein
MLKLKINEKNNIFEIRHDPEGTMVDFDPE